MGDLDSILQDFSYLKSLEHRDRAPKKLHSKLFLPDPRCGCVSVLSVVWFMWWRTSSQPRARLSLTASSIAQSVIWYCRIVLIYRTSVFPRVCLW